ncbi:XdhC family aldehyde oxidoreductase maturation factor [Maridesulfovibrio ferrireducens]|uniref:XdhC family aldehyde oxidoreductase maturation factor n=1 Tax=Maridesulfovibrio ferrireducens TaxID=246191 RepID=UPI001A307F24|nr:XdhC/CoxI family protein [Maridesulfovibrio ferrireducens]MBI9112922.1 XdhC family protein [Maridesulfovibrio ferrireducens]
MKKLVHNIRLQLESGNDLILASIVESTGSTPRSSGSKMAVRRDGKIDGTIGGGLVEALVQRAAAKLFDTQNIAVSFKEFDLSNTLAANADMICGGHVTVMMEHLYADKETTDIFIKFDNSLKLGQKVTILSLMDNEENSATSSRMLLTQNQATPAVQGFSEKSISELQAASLKKDTPIIQDNHNQRLIAESFTPQPSLFIFGAGHVSRPTAALATSVNFRTVVLDDRIDFANIERFPEADEIEVLPNFNNAFANLEVTEDSYIIIVTRGHLHDKTVLAQALKTPACYVGMIGSSKKRNAIYDALLEEGVTQTSIDRCHCPIGLGIGAQTPEEIAVSIVAELIKKRAGD